MKNKKRIIGILLTLVLVFAMAIPVGAFAEAGTITINNAKDGHTYTAYKILDLESYSNQENAKAFSYTVAEGWGAFVSGDGAAYFKVENGYVTWKDGADAAELAKDALKYAKEKSINAAGTATATGTTAVIEVETLGYYLVDTSLGSLCSLDTTTPGAQVNEKNEIPTIDKLVQEDSTNEWGTTNDADMNQTVNFTSTIGAKKGAENYVMHDVMSAGLTYAAVTAVKVNDVEIGSDNYTVVVAPECDKDCDFHVVFEQAYLDTITADTDIVVEYSATLNTGAVVGLNGNPNDAKLSYGDNSETEWSKTITYTWDAMVIKHTGVVGEATFKTLPGAEFKLYREDGKYVQATNGKVTAWVDEANASVFTSDANGEIKIAGLDRDTYFLVETKAPTGYNKLNDPVEVEIVGKTYDAEAQKDVYNTATTYVQNNTGTEMPETGGMGTTLFYLLGAIMVIGAGVVLVTRRRVA